jgi:undecaprenyl-diphosphatase
MSVPAVLGAGILKWRDGIEFIQVAAMPFVIGFCVSAVVGCLAIGILLRLVNSGKFYFFGYYCILMSVVAFGYTFYF